MNEFIEQFLLESRELVEQGTRDLLALEHRPHDREQLASAFRAFHTLKGGAGIVDFAAMARALHAAEDILAAVRADARPLTPRLVGDCLACLDQVVIWLDAIEAGGVLPPGADAEADAVIARLTQGQGPARPAMPVPAPAPRAEPETGAAARAVLEAQILLLAEMPDGAGSAGRIASAARVAANVLRRGGRPDTARAIEQTHTQARNARDPSLLAAALTHAIAEEAPPPAPLEGPGAVAPERGARTLRIAAERIDALVDLTGELTIAKNALGHLARQAQQDDNRLAPALREQQAAIDRLVAALQHAVLTMRVLPLRQVFQRFPRLVREMAASLDKPCRLDIAGDDTEADKTIVEGLYEPLLHILRNAVDHGIEAAPRRAAAGKPAIATIDLRASREGEQVVIEIEDDGAGIDIAKVRAVAAARGLAGAETLAALSDAETIDLIFAPGFSTAAIVTEVSGRGVGMDAVRNAVERLGGRVTVASQPGVGSIVRFHLPFSVMMTQVMTVEAGGQAFGIPLDAVVETVQVERASIRPVSTARAVAHRNRTVPVIDLEQTLGRNAGDRTGAATLVIVTVAGQFGALEVDRIGERMEILLKPMAGLLSGMPGVAGTTLSGNGDVLLVLDVQALLS